MSLIAWLPLCKNSLYDNMGNTLTTSKTLPVFNASGKIGGSYVFTNNNIRIKDMKATGEMSFAVWVKLSSSTACHILDFRHSSGEKGYQPIYYNPSSGIQVYSSTSPTGAYIATGTLTVGTWYHITVVISSGKATLYLNGVNKGTISLGNPNCNTELTIGTRCNGNNPFPGSLNDVRVYDHALSEREVKDLVKGLMVHYGLEDPFVESTTNVSTVSGWSTYASYWTIKKRTDTGLIIYRHSSSTSNTVAISNSAVTSKMAVGDIWTFSCYLYKGGQPYKCNLTSPSTSGYGYTGISCVSRDDGYYAVTFQINSNGAGAWVLHTTFFGTTDLNVDCEMRYMQFEKKDHATPFTLSSRTGYVADNSGNGYNGTPIDIVMSEENGRGQYAAVFNGTTSGIDIPFIKSDLVSSDWTISFWLYSNDANSSGTVNRSILIGDYNLTDGTKFNIEKQDTPGRVRTWYNGGSSSVYHTGTVIPYQSWCNLTITYKSGVTTMYLNGQPTGDTLTYTITSTKSSGALRIGRDNRTDGTGLKGKIADFKMYATALSADEVAYEAKKSKRFFRSGRVEVKGLQEQTEGKACVKSNILQKANCLVETSEDFWWWGGDTKGGIVEGPWLHVMHHNNRGNTNKFSSSDDFANSFVYHNDDCWSAFHLITEHGFINNGYTFLVMDEYYDGTHSVQFWTQDINPVTTDDQPKISWGKSSFGGLRKNGTNTFMSRPDNWWAACGAWNGGTWGGVTGVPGFTDMAHACPGSMDLFVRVTPETAAKYREFKGGIVELYEIDEI